MGITRAKKSLAIHYNDNGNYFSGQKNYRYAVVDELTYTYDNSVQESSNYIIKQLRHRDIFLSYFYKVQKAVENLKSGDELKMDEAGCLDLAGNRVLYFSERFKKELQQFEEKGYHPVGARVDYILYWKEEDKEEVPIVFPLVGFERTPFC
ncbi:MAG TPA: hypothetical protein GXX75_18925 [Clostridiales bacterium]|nr:hypothetical protein [Clostridiales bacterium]